MWAYLPKRCYVGVGTVTGEARLFDDVEVTFQGRTKRLATSPATARIGNRQGGLSEWVLPVRWHATRDSGYAFWGPGLFASRNSTCRFRDEDTLKALRREFRYPGPDSDHR